MVDLSIVMLVYQRVKIEFEPMITQKIYENMMYKKNVLVSILKQMMGLITLVV